MSNIRWIPLLFLLLIGCTQGPDKAPAKFTPEKPRSESDLAFTNLTKKAYIALQIKTQPIAVTDVHERLALTGWIMAKPGHEVTLTAPAAGYVYFPKGENVPIAGSTVKAGQELMQIKPVLSPVEQIEVAALKRGIESDLIKAEATLKAAEKEMARAQKLAAIRTKQDLELAQKALDHAVEELAGAKDKLKYFDLPPVSIKAPQRGMILLSPIGAGQYVAASAPLVTIIDLNPIWIRVPVPEYDLPRIDPQQSVTISWKNANHDRIEKSAFLTAKPAGRVALVDPIKHTADLWYELEPSKDADRFVKDQMVTVHVVLSKTEKAVVVPYSAIIFDTHGHAWIYLERTTDKDAKHRFERRPVEMVNSTEDGIIIRANLANGDRLVTSGAAILFSRDFHKTPVAEDE